MKSDQEEPGTQHGLPGVGGSDLDRPCPRCGAESREPCRTPKGSPTDTHAAREQEIRADGGQSESGVGQCQRCGSDDEDLTEIAIEDARGMTHRKLGEQCFDELTDWWENAQ